MWNATYGVLGAPTSAYYNIYVASAITIQGKAYISTSIMLFESFLANNVKFNSLNEVITFINNVKSEKVDRKFDDRYILDRNISLEECFFKLMNTMDPLIWVPTEKEMSLVWEYLLGVSQEDINRIYYKNNLYVFCELKPVMDLIIKILCELDINVIDLGNHKYKTEFAFMNANEPPELIKEDIEALTIIIKEYVYYPHFYTDKLDRIDYMQRDIVAISDTDSTIISFDGWYRFILDKVYDIDMPIKHYKANMYNLVKQDEFGDRPKRKMYTRVKPSFDYNFYTDEVIESYKRKAPIEIIPQELLRYSIINIIAYICSNLVVDYLAKYCRYAGSERDDGTKCFMVMKNEFTFKSVLLTNHRRNYADIQEVQEGNMIPNSQKARLAVMGLTSSPFSIAI